MENQNEIFEPGNYYINASHNTETRINICNLLNNMKFMHYDSQTIGKLMSIFRKQDILFNSRIYYQKKYNKANFLVIAIFHILKYWRKVELLIEVPIKKLIYKLKNK